MVAGADDASSLKLDSIGGIFYVLIFGTVLGCIIAVIEFIWKSKKNASRDEVTKKVQSTQVELRHQSHF